MKKLWALLKKLSFRKLKLRGQMYMVYVFALIIPLAIAGVVLVLNADSMLNDYYMDLLKSENLRVRSLLMQITTQAYNISDDICFNSAQKKILSEEYENSVDFVRTVNSDRELDDIIFNHQEIWGIYIYTDNDTAINYKQYNVVTEEIRQKEWYKRALSQTSAFWTLIETESNYTDKQGSYLALVRRIMLPNSDYEAVVVIKLGDAYIRSKINSKLIDAISVDDAGIVYSSRSGWYKQKLPVDVDYNDAYYSYYDVVEIDGTKCFTVMTTASLHMTTSKLHICTMDDNVYYEVRTIINSCILILVLAIFIPGVVLFWYANKFTKRVYLLREEMHKASYRNYDMSLKFNGHDELTDAYEDLKLMVNDIKEKDAKIYEAELNEKELRNNQQIMEYKMLAGQINPHYLYNTLETIRMKALSAGNREIADCIKILGKTLQYVLKNTGTTVTTLKKEIEHVENYLAIQKLRFRDRINYTLDIQDGLVTEELQVLPLMLQPIVENAVIHGLEHMDGNGMIAIEIYLNKKEQLTIVVSDNGKGMKKEEYEELCKKLNTPGLKPESNIGVYNICERIRLHYGSEYGLQIESGYGQGTKVMLILPA